MRLGIVDDRADVRETIVGLFQDTGRWDEVLSLEPLRDISRYTSLIFEEELSALVVDERLDEASTGITYQGHEVAKHLREKSPSFPVMLISANDFGQSAKNEAGQFEALISRDELTENHHIHSQRLARSASNWRQQHLEGLARLGELAEKIAAGDAIDDDVTEAKAIQTQLNIEASVVSLAERDEILTALEEEIQKLEAIINPDVETVE